MDDRRKFHRVNAPVFCRPLGQPLFGRRKAVDVSLGGLRVYADEPPMPGDRLELELFLPDQSEVVARSRWCGWTDYPIDRRRATTSG